jgi:hypothetical protein
VTRTLADNELEQLDDRGLDRRPAMINEGIDQSGRDQHLDELGLGTFDPQNDLAGTAARAKPALPKCRRRRAHAGTGKGIAIMTIPSAG